MWFNPRRSRTQTYNDVVVDYFVKVPIFPGNLAGILNFKVHNIFSRRTLSSRRRLKFSPKERDEI